MKKLFLNVITFLSVAICSVIAFAGINYSKGINTGSNANNGVVDNIVPVEDATTRTYRVADLSIQKGGNTINYTYTPSVNSKDTTYTVAYEYVFGSSMDDAIGVNLKTIDTSEVDVAYYYSSTKLNPLTETITADLDYECQEINQGKIYVYILVSPKATNIPAEFTRSIVWYFGKLGTTQVYDNITNTYTTQKIVKGQTLEDNTLKVPTVPQNYVFEGWYLDKNYTQPATFPFTTTGQSLYAKMVYDRSPLYANNGTIDSEGYYLYGAYPQDYVGDTLNETLKTQLENNTLVSTDWEYTTDIDGTTVILPEYVYEGNFYAYLSSSKTYNTSYTFNTDISVTIGNDNAYFFNVEPLRWTNNNGTYLCEQSIGSRRFDESETLWANSEIREYLNEVFYLESGISQFKTSKTTIQNNSINGEIDAYNGTSTEDYIWLPSYQEMTAWYNSDTARRKSCSDMAKATYTYWHSNYASSYYWTRSADSYPDVYLVSYDGCLDDLNPNTTDGVICPAFSLDRNDTLYGLNGLVDSEGYTLYGAYPQDYVGDTLNTTLTTSLNAGTLTATGYSYTTDINNTTTILPEYVYNGEYYAYLASAKVCDRNFTSVTINTDTSVIIVSGNAYFFKVKPLRWTNHNETYLCEYSIGSMRFNEDKAAWDSSEMREYLNEVFYVESGISLVKKKTTTIPNNTTNGEIDAYNGTATKDYIWIPSYQEINTWYTTDVSMSKGYSDLAKATYMYWDSNYSTSFYWTRSCSPDNGVYIVWLAGGTNFTNNYFGTYNGVCPCFRLDK